MPNLPFPGIEFVIEMPGRNPPFDFWAVTPTGNSKKDFCVGEVLAVKYIDALSEGRGGWAILQNTVQEMVRKGDRSAVVVGFMGVISRVLVSSLFSIPEIRDGVDITERSLGRQFSSLPGSDDGFHALNP